MTHEELIDLCALLGTQRDSMHAALGRAADALHQAGYLDAALQATQAMRLTVQPSARPIKGSPEYDAEMDRCRDILRTTYIPPAPKEPK